MNKKKIIIFSSIGLAVLLVVGILLWVFLFPESNEKAIDSKQATEIDEQLIEQGTVGYSTVLAKLKKSEIIGNQFDSVAPTDIVTRAEFIKILCDLTDYGNSSEGMSTVTFSDIPENHWANKYIAFCEELGIIDNTAGSEFKPDDSLLFEDILRWILAERTWEERADDAGGTFEARYEVAYELGYLNYISYFKGDEVNYYTVLMFIWNVYNPENII